MSSPAGRNYDEIPDLGLSREYLEELLDAALGRTAFGGVELWPGDEPEVSPDDGPERPVAGEAAA